MFCMGKMIQFAVTESQQRGILGDRVFLIAIEELLGRLLFVRWRKFYLLSHIK